MRPNPRNGNLTQVGSRSSLGSWELLGIFKSLFVFTLENQAVASAPLNPTIENPEAARRNAKCQWSDSGSTFAERKRWRYKSWPRRREGAGSETVLTALKVSIAADCERSSPADPGPRTKARPARQNVWTYGEKRVRTNKTDLGVGIWTVCVCEGGVWLETSNIARNSKF